MTVRIGFVLNPIAGMGGKVGLKGTDNVYEEAVTRGAEPVAFKRAQECFSELAQQLQNSDEVSWYTCDNNMGKTVLDAVGITNYKIVYKPKIEQTSSEDTKKACTCLVANHIDLLVFCGGDGTARDVAEVVKDTVPILGVPSGVKMHSAVFGINPKSTGKTIYEFINGQLRTGEVEIMDLDETLYRKGIWKVRLYDTAKGLVEPTYIQVGKQVFSEVSEEAAKDELAEHISDEITDKKDTLFLFGSGGTIDYIAKKLKIDNTLLGIDAVFQNKTIRKDVNEKQIIELLKEFDSAILIISPIGAQGFIIGRGNLQLSPKVIKHIGIDNILVISTPSKIIATPYLRVDSGDPEVDHLFFDHEMMMVLIGYRLFRVVHIQRSE